MADERWHRAASMIAEATRGSRRDLNVLKSAAELQLAAVLETVKDEDPRAELLLALGREAQLEQEKATLEARVRQLEDENRALTPVIDRA